MEGLDTGPGRAFVACLGVRARFVAAPSGVVLNALEEHRRDVAIGVSPGAC